MAPSLLYYSRWWFCIASLLALPFLLLNAGCATSQVRPVVPVELGDAIEKISAERTWSEFVAKDAALYRAVKPAYYGTIKASYTDAQAAFNAGIDRLKFAVDNGDDLSPGSLPEG